MAQYVYGLMRAHEARAAVARSPDATGPPLRAIEHDGLCALVTDVPDTEIKLRRESALAHAGILQAAFEHGPVLPLRFGTVLPDEHAVTNDLLAPGAKDLLSRLDSLDGRAEMQVKATYLEEPLLRSILAQDQALARAVKRVQALPPAATHFERIRIGEATAGAVLARRATDGEELLGALRPLAVALSVSEPKQELGALDAAFLVDRSGLARFDKAVEELSEARGALMQFKLIGPLPAHSFADREWEATGEPSGREAEAKSWA